MHMKGDRKVSLPVKKIGIVVLLVCLGFAIARCVYLNIRYPNPSVQTYEKNEIVTFGNYEISLTDWQWSDGEIIHEIYPGYKLIEIDGEEYPTEKERVGLVEITITKTADDNTKLDLTEIFFESGAWGNQWDIELFTQINPDLEKLVFKMDAGETKKIIFPMTMNDTHFSEKDWKNIDNRKFYIVLQYYPIKYQLLCN